MSKSNIYKLKYSVNEIEFQETHDNRFMRATIRAFADGQNAHTHPISLGVLQKGSETVYDIPILCKYSKLWDDFEGHEDDEVPIGFIKESSETYDNPIRFEQGEDGRTFLVIEGTIWVQYSGEAFRVLSRDKTKSVSVELMCAGTEINNRIEVEDFILQGITILGDFINPAVKGANLKLEFSRSKEEYLKSIEFSIEEDFDFAESIDIDNSKEAAVSGSWSNPARKLFDPIVEASNSKSLLNEAYLITDFSTEEPQITRFKYPHHVVRGGKLVIHERGLQAAFSRAAQQGIVRGDVKSHLLRHYRELGLSTENFSEFGMSEEMFNIINCLMSEESVGEENMSKENKDFQDTEVELQEEKKNKEIPTEEDTKKEDMAVKQPEPEEKRDVSKGERDETKKERAKGKEEDMAVEQPKPEKKEEVIDKDDDKKNMAACGSSGGEDKKMSADVEMQGLRDEIEVLKKSNADLEVSNKTYMEKLEKMSDYDDLIKFKKEAESKVAIEAQLSNMNKVLSDIEGRGIAMSDEEKQELIEKFSEYDNIEAWSNFAKAQIFDKAENLDGVVKIGLPFETKKQTNSIWDNL